MCVFVCVCITLSNMHDVEKSVYICGAIWYLICVSCKND